MTIGGGALYLALGVLAALRHAERTGEGQVIDCAMSDGAATLMGMLYGHLARGSWQDARAANIIDGGAPFYNIYRCADGLWLAVGAIEPQFFAALVAGAGIDAVLARIAARRRAVAAAPGSARGAVRDPHAARVARAARTHRGLRRAGAVDARSAIPPAQRRTRSVHEIDGVVQPAPAPRFSRTPAAVAHGPVAAGEGGEAALGDWGVERA